MDFSKIDVPVLFIISLVCAVANSNYRAHYVKNTMARESGIYSFNAGISLICAISLLILSGFNVVASPYSVLFGVLFGAVGMLNSAFVTKSIEIGPFGYTTVIVNLSTALTALSGAIFWGESLSVFKVIGIVLMMASFYFAIDKENDNGKKANKVWFLLSMLSLLTCAMVGIMQKIYQSSVYKGELTGFLLVAFLTSAMLSSGWYLRKKKCETAIEEKEKKSNTFLPFLIAVLICGIGAAGNNILNLYLSGVTETAIFFPIVNGVPLLTNLLVAFLIFKEKLKPKQLIGFFMGIVAIICLFI